MEELVSSLGQSVTIRAVKKGTTLLYQSEIPRQAFIVRKGFIRAYTITSSGDERIVALHGKGDVFPLSWAYGETKNTLFYYEAGSDAELACVSKEAFVSTIADSPELMAKLLKFTVNEHTALLMRITALEQSNAAEKIALTLYYLLIRHGLERRPGLFTIDIKMTQSTIASLVGLTRESTAVNLAKLKERDVITYSNFIYVVNKRNLERFIGEDSFKDISLR
ncbi:Fumarate and nitrate reduction regulatory protein [compost metagenome]